MKNTMWIMIVSLLLAGCGVGTTSSDGCTVTTIPDATGNGSITTQVCD